MKKRWSRIGMTSDVSDEEYKKIKKLTNSKIDSEFAEGQRLISKLFRERGRMNGNSYMPDNSCCESNPNDWEFEFDI